MHMRWTYVLPATIARWCCILKGTLLWQWGGEDYNHTKCVWMSPFFLPIINVFFVYFFSFFVVLWNFYHILNLTLKLSNSWLVLMNILSTVSLQYKALPSITFKLSFPAFPLDLFLHAFLLMSILTVATCSSKIHEISSHLSIHYAKMVHYGSMNHI